VLHLLAVLLESRGIALILWFDSLLPETDEGILATSLHFEGDALSVHDGLFDTHEDGACNGLTWLVEWLVSRDLHVALFGLTLIVSEKFHGSYKFLF